MSNFIVRKAAVLGAGVMGAQIAAHCVNARVPVVLFDLPAKDGIKDEAGYVEVANYDDHLEALKSCDLIIEAIAERMDWKHDLYKKVAPFIAPNAIFASNTSGLSITELAEGFDAELKARFCGVHFFNPPRYMHLVELIPTAATAPAILDQLEGFLTTTLGKGVVRAKDTPNFIANRVGIFGMLATMHEAEKFGLSCDVVDDLTGAKLGRAKSGTFRTADVVGLDTMGHVIKTMQDNLAGDPFFEVYKTPAVLTKLVQAGALGQKTGAGFYKKVGKDIQRLDFATGAYVAGGGKTDDLIARILKEKDPAKRMKTLRESKNPQAQFLWAIFRDVFHYIAVHLETIADNARDVDFAMRWGFGQGVGPFETWQSAGWQQIAGWIKEDIDGGKALCPAPLPAWVSDGRSGAHAPEGSWSASRKCNVPRSTLPVYQRQLFRAPVLGSADAAAGGAFSVGADLKSTLPLFMSGGAKAIEPEVAKLQQAHLAMKYGNVPVVAAVAGLALGGGCELMLHAARRVASIESYIGLVEVGVGLIPAGGGLKEAAARAAADAKGNDLLQFLK